LKSKVLHFRLKKLIYSFQMVYRAAGASEVEKGAGRGVAGDRPWRGRAARPGGGQRRGGGQVLQATLYAFLRTDI
jgi:hypothetical protein